MNYTDKTHDRVSMLEKEMLEQKEQITLLIDGIGMLKEIVQNHESELKSKRGAE